MTQVTGYKAFNTDWTCRGFQFEVGQTYTHEGDVELCRSGFHYCIDALDVLGYYDLNGSKFAEVVGTDPTPPEADCSKVATGRLTVTAEVTMPKFIGRIADAIAARAKAATTGDHSAAATTGDRSAAATTGYRSAAATTGNCSAAATAGDFSAAATTGRHSPAVACGINSTASAGLGSSICVHEYDGDWNLIAVACSMVGQNGIEPNVAYKCVGGKLVKA